MINWILGIFLFKLSHAKGKAEREKESEENIDKRTEAAEIAKETDDTAEVNTAEQMDVEETTE